HVYRFRARYCHRYRTGVILKKVCYTKLTFWIYLRSLAPTPRRSLFFASSLVPRCTKKERPIGALHSLLYLSKWLLSIALANLSVGFHHHNYIFRYKTTFSTGYTPNNTRPPDSHTPHN